MNLDIKEITNNAVSTAGLIIGASIFLQMLTTKYISVFERYRILGGEYRESSGDARRDSLEEQITLYYRRCHLLQKASQALMAAEYVFLVTILSTTLSVIFPETLWIKILCGLTLLMGLILIGVGGAYEVVQNRLSSQAIDSEIKDFPDLPRKHSASPAGREDRHEQIPA